jgi:leucyl-tRNA synthetase
LQRKENTDEKTGVFTNEYAINPLNKKKIPIYVADYILNNYGTGIIMGVPAHDQRDFMFAKKFNIEIIKVINVNIDNEAYEGDGEHINSDFMNGLNNENAIKIAIKYFENKKIGKSFITYKLHD